jgi:hypothetical protein
VGALVETGELVGQLAAALPETDNRQLHSAPPPAGPKFPNGGGNGHGPAAPAIILGSLANEIFLVNLAPDRGAGSGNYI